MGRLYTFQSRREESLFALQNLHWLGDNVMHLIAPHPMPPTALQLLAGKGPQRYHDLLATVGVVSPVASDCRS